jgi:Stress responsive A/B Barrel Domain
MKNSKLLLLNILAISIFFACGNLITQPGADQKPTTQPDAVLRHVVLFKFKDGTTPDQVKEIEQAFAGLKKQMPELVLDLEYGTNNSPENLSQELTHCFMLTFASEKERDAYLPHPAHQAFVDKYAKTYVDKVTVLDYVSKKE